MASGLSYRFTDALLRLPASSVTEGLRAIDSGDPDITLFLSEHNDYANALQDAGVTTEILPSLPEFPDSVFIEDSALCLPKGAIALRPGAPSRTGESVVVNDTLKHYYENVETVADNGFIEGGDILLTDREILVGLSSRTDEAGFLNLKKIVEDWGYNIRMLQTPSGILHFKTACGILDGDTIFATRPMIDSGTLDGYQLIRVPEGEEAAANIIRVNNTVLVSDGYPKSAETISNAGYKVSIVPTSQAALLDGGLSCMSLRFHNAGSDDS